MMNWRYIIVLVAVVLIIVPLIRNLLKRRRDHEALSREVHGAKGCYMFLIDKKFRVKETNFYELNENIHDDQPYVLGNVLHCQEGCESGLCGTGIACSTCPIRMVIRNAFKLKRDFDQITATMHLYDEDHQVRELDVKVSGRLAYVGNEPHLLVRVDS